METQKFRILEIQPDSAEDADKIVTAYIKIPHEQGRFIWVFIPNWSQCFPYYPNPSKWGTGKDLVRNLIGKNIELDFKLIDFAPVKKTIEQKKLITQAHTDNTEIIGKIVKKELIKQGVENTETNFVDCGLEIRLDTKKDRFKIGDIVKAKGLLQAYIKKVEEEILK